MRPFDELALEEGIVIETYILRQSFCVRCRGVYTRTHTCNPTAFTFTVNLAWARRPA